jgi:hypothetical protein
MNDDGFLDNPLGKQINLVNRWQYANQKLVGFSFVNFRYMNDEKQIAEIILIKTRQRNNQFWGSEINTEALLIFLPKSATFLKICHTKVWISKCI